MFLGEDEHHVIGIIPVGSECLCFVFGSGLIHGDLFEWLWVSRDLVLLDVNVGRKCVSYNVLSLSIELRVVWTTTNLLLLFCLQWDVGVGSGMHIVYLLSCRI